MKVKFLGGADLVGKLGMLVENQGASIMFEYGMRLVKKEIPQFPMPASNVDAVFITHSHLDHRGAVLSCRSRAAGNTTKYYLLPFTVTHLKSA